MPLASGEARGSVRHAAGARAARFLGVATASQASSGGSRLALAADWVGCAATLSGSVHEQIPGLGPPDTPRMTSYQLGPIAF